LDALRRHVVFEVVSAAYGGNAFSARQHARDELRRSRFADDQAGEKTEQPGEDGEPSIAIDALLIKPEHRQRLGRRRMRLRRTILHPDPDRDRADQRVRDDERTEAGRRARSGAGDPMKSLAIGPWRRRLGPYIGTVTNPRQLDPRTPEILNRLGILPLQRSHD
jgi:hypothetical protein